MSSSQPYSFNDWFGILANPKDTINYLHQRALESTKPTKELDSRYTQPPPPSALDKVNKIMKG